MKNFDINNYKTHQQIPPNNISGGISLGAIKNINKNTNFNHNHNHNHNHNKNDSNYIETPNSNTNLINNKNETKINNPKSSVTTNNKYTTFGLIIFILSSFILYKDFLTIIYNMFGYIKPLFFSNTRIDMFFIYNLIHSIIGVFVTLFLLSPDIFKKQLKNPLYTFSQNISIKITDFFNVGIINFITNRDNIIKIIFNVILLIITLSIYHYSISQVFIHNDNILNTISFLGFFLLIGIYTSLITKKINDYNNVNVSESHGKMGQLTFFVFIYLIGSITILYIGEEISKNIYNFLINIEFINNVFL